MIKLKGFIAALAVSLALLAPALAGQDLPTGLSCAAALAPQFAVSSQQVRERLNTYGKALQMGYFKRQALTALVDAPEHRQYFNPTLAPALFGVEPQGLTVGHVAEKLFEIFTAAEMERLAPLSRDARLRAAAHWAKGFAHRRYQFIKNNVSGVVVGGIIVAFIAPTWQQPLNEFQSALYRFMPDFMRPAEIIAPERSGETVSPPEEVSDFYTRIWRQTNEGVPMNQREGRSYYYEADTLLLMLDGNARALIMAEPTATASAEDQALWQASLTDIRADIERQPELFPDVYHTDYAREHIEPRRLRLLTLIDRALTE